MFCEKLHAWYSYRTWHSHSFISFPVFPFFPFPFTSISLRFVSLLLVNVFCPLIVSVLSLSIDLFSVLSHMIRFLSTTARCLINVSLSRCIKTIHNMVKPSSSWLIPSMDHYHNLFSFSVILKPRAKTFFPPLIFIYLPTDHLPISTTKSRARSSGFY